MNLNDYYHNVYSQRGEDGILEKIFDTMGITRGRFVEFGAWDGRYLCNSRLLYEKGWQGLFIEGDKNKYKVLTHNYSKSKRVVCINRMVKTSGRDSFDAIINKHYKHSLDFVCIDVDGLDYYLLSSIKQNLPKVFCVEGGKYVYPLEGKELPKPLASAYVGQSLRVFQKLAESKGYTIVCFTQNIILVQNKYAHLFPVSKDLQELYLEGIRRHSFSDIKYMQSILYQYNIKNPLIRNLTKNKFTRLSPDHNVDHSYFSFNPKIPIHVRRLFPYSKDHILIKNINLHDVYASIVVGTSNGQSIVHDIPLVKTPHYAFLNGNHEAYKVYLKQYGPYVGFGKDHSTKQYATLIKSFRSYLDAEHADNYLICYQKQTLLGKKYIILDGVHRAAILASQNVGKIPICILTRQQLKPLSQFDQYLADFRNDFLEWYTPIEINGRVIHERTYPSYRERPVYLTNKERGKSKWDFIIRDNLPNIKGKRICDLGCNVGLYSIYLSQLGAKSVDGYDRTESIVQPTNIDLPKQNVVQQAYFVRNLYRLAGYKVSNNVRFIEQDLSTLDFSLLDYDLLFSSCVLYHFGKKKFRQFIGGVSNHIPEIFLQTNLGHKGGELEETASLAFHRQVLESNGYTVKIVAPPEYNYPIIYARKKLIQKS